MKRTIAVVSGICLLAASTVLFAQNNLIQVSLTGFQRTH